MLAHCLHRRCLQAKTSFVEAMHQLSISLYKQGDVKTSMPKPVEVGDIKSLVESQSGDAASLRDVKDLYPCMLTMCGSAGSCIAVRAALTNACQSILTALKYSTAKLTVEFEKVKNEHWLLLLQLHHLRRCSEIERFTRLKCCCGWDEPFMVSVVC